MRNVGGFLHARLEEKKTPPWRVQGLRSNEIPAAVCRHLKPDQEQSVAGHPNSAYLLIKRLYQLRRFASQKKANLRRYSDNEWHLGRKVQAALGFI
jgi:hypothetical protein